MPFFTPKCKQIRHFFRWHPWLSRNILEKKLLPMKLFPPFFVLTCEDNDKLNVAEIEHDNDHYKAPAPRGRPAKSFAGADC
jgi:hypothetical protein